MPRRPLTDAARLRALARAAERWGSAMLLTRAKVAGQWVAAKPPAAR